MLNPTQLTKQELVKRLRFKCKHRHNGIDHSSCYYQETGIAERVAVADIESSNLNASFGIVYTYCIKFLGGKMITRCIDLDDLHKGLFDKVLLQQFIKDCEGIDRLIFHYGVDRFDLPFLRSRAVYWKLPFPQYKCLSASDTYPILKYKFKLHSNRLESACDFLNIPSKKHKIKPDIWLAMLTGNRRRMQKSLRYIQTHCQEDVTALEELWERISPYSRLANTSI